MRIAVARSNLIEHAGEIDEDRYDFETVAGESYRVHFDILVRQQCLEDSDIKRIDFNRRDFLAGIAASTAGLAVATPRIAVALDVPAPPAGVSALDLARDESFWRDVASFYDRTEHILNLEHGYWGKMSRPVHTAYVDALSMVNTENSFYARKGFAEDDRAAHRRIADALGVGEDEIVITRNATEAFQALVQQYTGLADGGAVLIADIDYPAFKTHMRSLGRRPDVRVVELALPPRASLDEIQDAYFRAFESNPDLKFALMTHVSNQHGLVVPIAEIAAEARRRGIDVICDAAQSWGLLDYRIADLGVDWAAFNLHKWIGAPLGTGVLYMRRGSLGKVAAHPGEWGDTEDSVAARIHPGTTNFAARLAIEPALDFHAAVGPANKEARLRYLRGLWTTEAESMPHIEVLGGKDEPSWTGIASFRLVGQSEVEDAKRLQARLESDFGIFTVIRNGLDSGSCVRITPQVFNTPDEIGVLIDAMRKLSA